MSGFAPLRDLLIHALIETTRVEHGRHFVRLKETGADARLRQVDIFDLPEDSILIKLDAVEQPKSLFQGKKGERKRCDYVLFTQLNAQPLLIFFELKSRAMEKKEIAAQFKGACCLVEYCDAALNHFHGQSGLLRQCEKRFVVFYKPSIAKQRTRPTLPRAKANSPDSPLRYPSPHSPSLKSLVRL